MSGPPPALILAGPTAAGKTAASLEVARAFGAVVVSADAMQVYRGMDIGTAKATPEERGEVLHYGLDVVEPHEPFDAAAFVALADAARTRHGRVVIAGGTSLYIQAFVRGLVATPPVDPALRQRLEGLEDVHAELARVDPELAARLHPNDRKRLVRGLEVFLQTGARLSELQAAHAAAPDRVPAAGLWLDREPLRPRIGERLGVMLRRGYVDEVRRLLDAGVGRDTKPMRSLGYRHLADHLCDDLELEEAVRRIERDTWSFARKQRNWMRVLGYPRVLDEHCGAALAAAAALWASDAAQGG